MRMLPVRLWLAIFLAIEINCKGYLVDYSGFNREESYQRTSGHRDMHFRFFNLSDGRTRADLAENQTDSTPDLCNRHEGKIQRGPAHSRLPERFPDVGVGENHRFQALFDIPRWDREGDPAPRPSHDFGGKKSPESRLPGRRPRRCVGNDEHRS